MTIDTDTAVPILSGNWSHPQVEQYHDVFNPSTGEVIAQTPMCGMREVDGAVQAASKAFADWARTPAPRRAEVMFRYRALLNSHFEELAALVTRENGKTLDESRGDVRRGIEVVDFACGIAQLLKGENLPQVANFIDGATTREPLGVCAGITPFNFPAMVPMWMFPVAIACGNVFILKPSEKVPLTPVRLGELLLEAGLPEGVFNIVHGGREVVDALCSHPGIASVSFVGSTNVARHVYTLACANGKRVQAAGGAKNVLLVMPNAEPEPTLNAIMGAAYGNAGQRCMAGSLLMGVGSIGDELRDRLVAAIDKLAVDDTSANPRAEMGPVIDGTSQRRIQGMIARGAEEGATLVRDGRSGTPAHGFFVAPTLIDDVTPEMSLYTTEVFGPVLSMLRPDNLDEAIALLNRVPYGNGATIFTSSGANARQFVREIQCGMIGVNVGVPAPMALFPFSGWNQSFFGDLHVQGMEGVQFYTRQKVVLSRWDNTYKRTQGW
ncbi:MAG: CoA-acylating methylmalonate-semialdehyde dehydrogenase [Roseiflexaceae bacterium]|nr:CoA-acylating methylmalonate-semialdehyde dehydrogenase [Roseiflexaceae bacterium]